MLTYKIHIQKAEEGGYEVFVPALPGCFTQGETIDEAIQMAKEAIEIYIEELTERGEKKNRISCTKNTTPAGYDATPAGNAATPAGVAITPCLERVIERT
ncbi:hypothetical protein CHS0354_023930 [Potamilus streckersoni]|uniref:HicB-like antitoxin of toxin-antitoxin system domain-containing protein n=1 Tax=Potamilus streckersoni TaxID=2493646 RepID=A0AAE0RZC1_9BIVA|nr:hypothetical protein CHS0354_023930 [Potamilus streckersoni]